ADVRSTEEMVRRIRPHDGIVTPLAVFPGTSLWDAYKAERGVDEALWESVGHDGLYVRPEPFTESAILALSSALENAGAENGYDRDDFIAHRAVVGESYATDLLEGESLERSGRLPEAERVYRDLAQREPWNPWPLMRLAQLALSRRDAEAAEKHAEKALS